MNNKKLQFVIEAVDNASKEFKKIQDSLAGVETSTKKTDSMFAKMTGGFVFGNIIYNSITRAAGAVKNLITESVVMSGQLEQTQAVVYQLGVNAGWTSEQINRTIDSIREQNKGIAISTELTKVAILTGLNEAQTLEIVARGRDVAAAANLNSDNAIKAMMQSIKRLQPQLLSTYGIEMNLVQVYKKHAEALGKKTSQLTYAEKSQAMYNAVIEEASRATGAYEQAMGSWYKKANSVRDMIADVKVVIGKLLSGAMKPIIDNVYNAVKAFNKWAMDGAGKLNPILERVRKLITALVMVVFNVGKAIIDVIKAAFMPLIKALYGTEAEFNNLIRIVKIWGNVNIAQMKTLSAVITSFYGFGKTILGVGKILYSFIKDGITNFKKFGSIIKTIFKAIGKALTGNFSEASDMIKDVFNATLSNTLDSLNSFADSQEETSKEVTNAWRESIQAWADMGKVQQDTAGEAIDVFKLLTDLFNNELPPALAKNTEGTKELADGFKKMEDKAKEFAQKTITELNGVANKIKDIQDRITELTIGNIKENMSMNEGYAEAYVDQEKLISDLKEDINKESDFAKREALKNQLEFEIAEFEKHGTIIQAFEDEVNEVRRRNSLSDLAKAVEDLNMKRLLINQEYDAKLAEMQKELDLENKKYDEIKKILKRGLGDYAKFLKEQEDKTIDSISRQIQAFNELARAVANAGKGKTTSIEGRAAGGAVSAGTPYVVGEAGPELFVPQGSGMIRPNFAGAGGGNITINFTGNEFLGEEGVAERIGEQLMRTIKDTIKL